MFIRRSFSEFLVLQSEAPSPPPSDWVIDWRWLSDADTEGSTFASERSLIDCPVWEKPKRPRPA